MVKLSIPRTQLFPTYRFAVLDCSTGKLIPVTLACIDLFSREPALLLATAVTEDFKRDLFDFSEIEVWMLPRVFTSEAVAVRSRITLRDWRWSPINLDCDADAVALQWGRGEILSLCVDRVSCLEAPECIQKMIRSE